MKTGKNKRKPPMDRLEFIVNNFSAAFVRAEYFDQFLDKGRRKHRPLRDFIEIYSKP